MNILMQNRYDALTNKGGDSYQMLHTKKYIEDAGARVDVSAELSPDLAGYDIVHLFNVTRVHETYLQFMNAKKQGKKIVLSPIYHSAADIKNYESKNLEGLHAFSVRFLGAADRIQLLKTLYYVYRYPKAWRSWAVQAFIGYTRQQETVLSGADYLIPNSRMEMDTIVKEISGHISTRYKIIYNGIDDTVSADSPEITAWLKSKGINTFVICAGRIEPRKNTLKIAQAMLGTEVPVVFAGRINRMHGDYASAFLKTIEGSKNLFYLQEVDQQQLATLYKRAKACVLASWFETTGLAGLEAGYQGCNVVITDKGYTREYYGDRAWYCDPESTESIKGSVIQSYGAERDAKQLPKWIQEKGFFWKTAAARTMECYEELLERKSNG